MPHIVSIHQPNYLPWLGYFYKINQSDTFVLLDNVQYVKGTVANRNSIKGRNGKALLLPVSVKLSDGWSLNYNQIGIDYSQKWHFKHLNQIRDAYGKAPWFKHYFPLLEGILKTACNNIAELNIALIMFFIKELGISAEIKKASDIPDELGEKNERNINLVKYFNGDVYLSGKGAAKYNDINMYDAANIKLVYSEFAHPVYEQINGDFLPNLSVVDALMNCGPEKTRILISCK